MYKRLPARKYTITVTVIPSKTKQNRKASRRGDLLWCGLSKDVVRGIWFHAFGQCLLEHVVVDSSTHHGRQEA